MKKALCIAALLGLLASLAACGLHVNAAGKDYTKGDIVFITDAGNYHDGAASRAVWAGIVDYGEEAGQAYRRIDVEADGHEARLAAVEAVASEAWVIVCLGAEYEAVVFEAQHLFPDVMFLLLDGEPYDSMENVYEITSNTHCVRYQEAEAGFLAGYAAVTDGYTKLGFCGGGATPNVIRYGYGFLQGAETAARQMGLGNGAIDVQYWYAGEGRTDEEIRRKTVEWYGAGTQVVFACDSGAVRVTGGVISAAVAKEGKVIGAGADRSTQSMTVLCSAVKQYEGSVKRALASLQENGGWWDADRAGWSMLLTVAEGGVGLSTEASAWRLSQFPRAYYELLLLGIETGGVQVDTGSSRDIMPLTTRCSVTDWGEG